MRKQFKDIDIYAGIKAQDGAKWIKDKSGLKIMVLRPTGRPQSTSRFVRFILRKTLRVWSTSTLQPESLPICVVRIR